jgi:hypothetical protein
MSHAGQPDSTDERRSCITLVSSKYFMKAANIQERYCSIMSKSDLNAVYTEQFRNHPEGHALYFKVPEHSMKPGSCGYFNESGHWRQIVQIAETEPTALAHEGWKPPARLIKSENQTGIEWPVKTSESIQEKKIEAITSAQ